MSEKPKETKIENKRVTRENIQKHLASEYEKDHEEFTGKFRNLEHKGGTLSFRYKKYKQDDYKQYHLTDGHTYTLPRMVIDHLNNGVHYRVYKELSGLGSDKIYAAVNDGSLKTDQKMVEIAKDPRCEFIPLEFMSGDKMDMLPNKVVQVTSTAS